MLRAYCCAFVDFSGAVPDGPGIYRILYIRYPALRIGYCTYGLFCFLVIRGACHEPPCRHASIGTCGDDGAPASARVVQRRPAQSSEQRRPELRFGSARPRPAPKGAQPRVVGRESLEPVVASCSGTLDVSFSVACWACPW